MAIGNIIEHQEEKEDIVIYDAVIEETEEETKARKKRKETSAERMEREHTEQIQSDAISKLYEKKEGIDNSGAHRRKGTVLI